MRSLTRRILSVFTLLALSACATQDYAMQDSGYTPRPEMERLFNVDTSWWQAYGDEQLNRLVTRALAANIDLARSAISVNRALYQARMLGADLVPAFSASTGGGSTLNTDIGVSTRSYSGGLDVSYELDLWGRLRNATSAQVWEYEATLEDKEAARLALVNNVVDAYYNLQYLAQAEDLTRQSIAFYENLLTIVEEKFRVGKVDGLEPITAKQSLLSEQSTLLDLQNQQKTSEQALRDLLNLRPHDTLDIASLDLLTVTTPPVDLEVPVAALGLRPDVQAAEYRLQRAFDSLGAERAGLYPSVSLGGSLSVSSREMDTFFDLPMLGGTVRLNFPFLQWNRLRWSIKSSEANLEEAELNFMQKVTTALNEVDAFYFAYLQSQAQLANNITKNEADAEITRYRQTRYEVGVDELRDWIQARNTEMNSRLAVLRSKYSVIENENAIYQALGGRVVGK